MLFARHRALPVSSVPFTRRTRSAVAIRTAPKLLAGIRFDRQTVELIGACVMMAAFLTLALFA